MDREEYNRLFHKHELNLVAFKPLNDCDEEVLRLVNAAIEAEREACVQIIEEYRISNGNSVAGELAREWTYGALKEIRDDIRARGDR